MEQERDDSDETEGRALYRKQADALASAQVNYGRRKVRRTAAKAVWCPFCKKEHVGGGTCMGHHP